MRKKAVQTRPFYALGGVHTRILEPIARVSTRVYVGYRYGGEELFLNSQNMCIHNFMEILVTFELIILVWKYM